MEKETFTHSGSNNISTPGEKLKEKGAIVRKTPSYLKQIHSKYFLIDRMWAIISTGNTDEESFVGIDEED